MKTITIEDMSARRDEVLADLAHGETFSVLDRGCEVATLLPRRVEDGGPAADDAFTGCLTLPRRAPTMARRFPMRRWTG